jgi:hypothetical protein
MVGHLWSVVLASEYCHRLLLPYFALKIHAFKKKGSYDGDRCVPPGQSLVQLPSNSQAPKQSEPADANVNYLEIRLVLVTTSLTHSH